MARRESHEDQHRPVRRRVRQRLGQIEQRRADHPLLRPAGILDRRHRQIGRRPVHQQPPAQEGRRPHAHIDRRRAARPGQTPPVMLGKSLHIVPGENAQARIAPPPGQRLADRRRRRTRGGDTRHDVPCDARGFEGADLVIEPAEQHRIPALQPHDHPAGRGFGDEQVIDVVLPPGRLETALARRNALGARVAKIEDRLRHQPVMHDHVGRLHQPQRLDGQEIGIAGSGAHQMHGTCPDGHDIFWQQGIEHGGSPFATLKK